MASKRFFLIFALLGVITVGCSLGTASNQPQNEGERQSAVTPIPEKPSASQRIFVLEGARYIETRSAVEKIQIFTDTTNTREMIGQFQSPPAGRWLQVYPKIRNGGCGDFVCFNYLGQKDFYLVARNTSKNVLDVTLFMAWEDASGEPLEVAEEYYRQGRVERLMPGENHEFGCSYFPEGAVEVEFWFEVKIPEPIPSSVEVKYVEHPSAKGILELDGCGIVLDNKGTPLERWRLNGITITNNSKFPVLRVNVNVKFNAGAEFQRERTFKNIVGSSSCSILPPGQTERVGPSVEIPYEADEIALSLEVEKINNPSSISVQDNIELSKGKAILADYNIDEDGPRHWRIDMTIIYDGPSGHPFIVYCQGKDQNGRTVSEHRFSLPRKSGPQKNAFSFGFEVVKLRLGSP